MVEGHGVRRVCIRHLKLLLNKKFKADSPNGRFTQGAKLISNQKLHRIESIGKNLFYFFGKKNSPIVVHIHFGMSGRFLNAPLNDLPKPTPTTRLRLVSSKKDNIGALLSAMTCNYGGLDLYEEKKQKLGQDPLREDADKKIFFGCTKYGTKSQQKAVIGDVLMDQSKIAGVGNIYRAEILYKARVHPLTRVNSLTDAQLSDVWYHSVDLLQRGFRDGSILTIDSNDKAKPSFDGRRRYIYNQSKCLCGHTINSFSMKGRTCYVCNACQKRSSSADFEVSSSSTSAIATPERPVKLFKSHCAPDKIDWNFPEKMTVKDLKSALSELGQSSTGKKSVLCSRLRLAQKAAKPYTRKSEIKVGVDHIKHEMRSAKYAAKNKQKAGEKRNVEHVALEDEESLRLYGNGKRQIPKRRRRKRS